MQFFHAQQVTKAFPKQALIQEFITLINQVAQAKKADFTATLNKENILTYPQFLELCPTISTELKTILTSTLVKSSDKVIFNYFEGKELSLETTEFHKYTYDIQLVLEGDEQYIFCLNANDPEEFAGEYKADKDVQFLSNQSNLGNLTLSSEEGVVIPPTFSHFSGFTLGNFSDDHHNEEHHYENVSPYIYKVVVKVNQDLFQAIYHG